MFYGRDSNTGGSDLWSSTLPLEHGGAPPMAMENEARHGTDYVRSQDMPLADIP